MGGGGWVIIYRFNDSVEITLGGGGGGKKERKKKKKKNNAGLGWAWLAGVTCSDGTGCSLTLRLPCLLWPCLRVIPNSQGRGGDGGTTTTQGGNGLPPARLHGSYLF